MIGWNYFFAAGKKSFTLDRFTPEMIESITAMLRDPQEATYVVEGALFAIGYMPPEVIKDNFKWIWPWTESDDWWFRHASFKAIQGMESDPELYLKAVPLLTEIMIRENHTMPRQQMNKELAESLKKFGPDSEIGLLLAEGYYKGVGETQILEGNRAREGKFNISNAIGEAARMAPETSPQLAASLIERGLPKLDDDELLQMVVGGRGFEGFLKVSAKLKGTARKSLEDLLYESYRPELSKRLKAGGGRDITTIDAILGIIKLRDGDIGWESIGSPANDKREWQYISFDPTEEKDMMLKREGRRYRKISLTPNLKNWFKPEFGARNWQSGYAPIGKGGDPRTASPIENRSKWGDGEFLLARTSFELNDLSHDLYRIRILCQQGFDVYLNGKLISNYTWFASATDYKSWPIKPNDAALLKKGTNTLAVYTMGFYPSEMKSHFKEDEFGRLDCYIEGLRAEDLY